MGLAECMHRALLDYNFEVVEKRCARNGCPADGASSAFPIGQIGSTTLAETILLGRRVDLHVESFTPKSLRTSSRAWRLHDIPGSRNTSKYRDKNDLCISYCRLHVGAEEEVLAPHLLYDLIKPGLINWKHVAIPRIDPLHGARL